MSDIRPVCSSCNKIIEGSVYLYNGKEICEKCYEKLNMLLDQEAELKQTIINSYKETFDLSLAYEKADCTPEQIKILSEDKSFQRTLNIYLIEMKEKIVQKHIQAMDSPDPKISFTATRELASRFYSEFSTRGEEKNKPPITYNVDLPFESLPEAEQKRIEEEAKLIHGGKFDL